MHIFLSKIQKIFYVLTIRILVKYGKILSETIFHQNKD